MPQRIVILPTYNERENIERLVAMLRQLAVGLGVVIVDDNSPDGTGDLADRLAAADPDHVSAIHRPEKLGLGTAYLAGFRRALELGAAQILTMDADFSHHPRYIPQMIERSKEPVDLVIGSRYVTGGGVVDSPLQRQLLSRGANAFARRLLKLQARDTTAGFRCYRRAVLEGLPLSGIFSNGYSFLIEMLYLAQDAGFSVAEVPIQFEDRKHGKSKISRAEIGKALVTVLRLAARRHLRRRMRRAGG